MKKWIKILLFILFVSGTNITTYYLTNRLIKRENLQEAQKTREEIIEAISYELSIGNELIKTSSKSAEAKRELTLTSYNVREMKDNENSSIDQLNRH